MKEASIQAQGLCETSKAGAIMFRVNTGSAWAGKVVKKFKQNFESYITLMNAQPLKAGLCKGGSDTIGWTSIVITPDMVGKKVALFTAIEYKTGKGKATPEQLRFINAVDVAGGIAGIARNPAQAGLLITEGKKLKR